MRGLRERKYRGIIKVKAKIKTLIILISIFALSLVGGLFAACIGEKNPKEKADELGMTACVTYYTNGGNFVSGTNSTDAKSYRTDFYRPDTPVYNIGVDKTSGQSLTIKRKGYVFTGWAYALLDEDGLPYLYASDEEGKATGAKLEVLESGTASMIGSTGREMQEKEKRFVAVVDEERGMVFENGHPKVGANEHIYLVATWEKDVVLEYVLLTDASVTAQVKVDEIPEEANKDDYTFDKDGNIFKTVTYKNGDVFYSESFATSTEIILAPESAPKDFEGFSFINLFWDAEGKQAVADGGKVTKHEDKTNSTVYAKYLSGEDWKAVRTVKDAEGMFLDSGYKYFVVYDINCEDGEFNLNEGTYSGVIEGNGRILSNINISATIAGNRERISFMGTLSAFAQIKNLTFKDVNIELNLSGKINGGAYVLVSNIVSGGILENVKMDTVTFDITLEEGSTIFNIQKNNQGVYQTGNWLYGVYGTDAEFVEKYGDCVQNATLIINGEKIVSGGQL